jgi:hypothetical protein
MNVRIWCLRHEEAAGRVRLQALYRDMPAFENHVLEQQRAFLLEELAGAATDASWLPAELAGWLLEDSPDDVQALGDAGQLPSETRDGARRFAARPCLERWAAAQLGRVRFRGDAEVREALDKLARGESAPAGAAARASLTALAAAEA